jgi:hypothetical protein
MTTERDVALRVVKTALDAGYTVKHDYGDNADRTTLQPGADPELLGGALGCTEEDWLHLYRPDGSFIGTIYLLWGNEEDGSELICDHTSNPETEAVANKAYVSLGLNLDLYGEQS